jgi:Family of unknown function (DUF6152)
MKASRVGVVLRHGVSDRAESLKTEASHDVNEEGNMSRRTTMASVVLGGALSASLFLSSEARAHHGWGSYDAKTTLNLTGVILESRYTNPHGLIRLQVGSEGGKTWLVVLAPPSRMNSRGLSQEMLRVGATLTVVGYPHRENPDELRAERITVEEKTIELR